MINELFSVSSILAWVIFGSIGMIYVAYGKWKDLWQPKALGFALMFYPYVTSGDIWLWGIGVLLTVAIFFARD